jgi:hypothetical protein
LIDSSKWKISGLNIFNKNTGNVGIGQTSPVYKLDISAVSDPLRLLGLQNGNFATDSLVVVQNGVLKKATPLNQFAWLQNGNSYGTLGILGTTDVNDLSFITSGSERIHIDTRGNTFGGGGNGFGSTINGGFIYGSENKVESNGKPSFAFGTGNTIEAADHSILIGEGNYIKSGAYNFGFGAANQINSGGTHNYAFGEKTVGGKEYVLSFGQGTDFSSLNHGFALGMSGQVNHFLALDNADSYVAATKGNLGIGTTTPKAQLHTTRDVIFEGIGTNTINTKIMTTDAGGSVTTRDLTSLLSGSAITSLNGLTSSTQIFSTGTSGTDFNIVSSGSTHTFNLPSASATNRGLLSTANWTTFNNKIGTVTATTPAAVTTVSNTATINNTAAYWNANQLQGKDIATTTPANGQVLTYNTTTAKWEPAAAAPVTTTVSNTNTAPNTLTTTVNGVTGTGVPIVNSVSNTSSANTIKTTVNGIAGATVNIINSNTLTQNGSNQLISTVNGVASTPLTANITGDVTGNLGASVVSKINGSPLGTTTGATSGQVLAWNGTAWAPASAAPATTTNTLSSSANTLTSVVNGISATAPAINTSVVTNPTTNTIGTTINGITSTSNATIIGSNTLTWTQAGGVSSSVNGVSSTVTPASGTLSQILGYNAAGTPVYNSISNLGSITLATGTTGTDVNVSGSPVNLGGTVTLNIPDASTTARGLVTTGAQTFAGAKTFAGNTIVNGANTFSVGTGATTLGGTLTLSSNIPNSVGLQATDSVLVIDVSTNAVQKIDPAAIVSGTAWLLKGNTGTTAGTNFIGTTDAKDFVTKTGNTERMRVLSTGNVGINTPTPGNTLEVNQGTAGNSGLRFTTLTSASTGSAPTNTSAQTLTVDASGTVIKNTGMSFVNTQSGTSYTLTAADNQAIVYTTNAAAVTIYVPTTLPVGFTCAIIQGGTGVITMYQGTTGTTAISNVYGQFKTAGQYASVTIQVPVSVTPVLSGETN